ncbi:MAG TPA: hypothetical protein VIK78_15255 [Ruminiclostridium sp.]
MFGKPKASSFNNIMAVKDYTKTVKAIEEGTLPVQFDRKIYIDLFKSQVAKVDNIKDLGKFIKLTKKSKADVLHFWEGLIVGGYTLIAVKYDEKTPNFERLCNNNTLKFVCTL